MIHIKKKILSLIVLLLLSTTCALAEVITIGSGTETDVNLPTYILYNYGLTQQIYTAEEIGMSGSISSISFKSTAYVVRSLDIYLVETYQTSGGWIAVTEENKVFGGDVSFSASDWTTITFNKPFEYDGNKNLAVIVDDNTGTWQSSISFYVYSTTDTMSKAAKDDYENFNPLTSIQAYSADMDKKNQIQLVITPYDGRPSAINVSDITTTTATVTWESDGTLWNLQYKAESDVDWTTVSNLNQKSYDITGLTPGQSYVVQIQTIKDSDELSGWKTATFSTFETNPIPTDVTMDNIAPRSAHATWNGRGDSYSLALSMIEESARTYNFENQELPSSMTTEGSYPWKFVEGDQGYYLQSSNEGVANSGSELSATVTYLSDGTIEFDALCKGEGSAYAFYDKCVFSIDGETVFQKSDDGNWLWKHVSFPVTSGTHTFIWRYTKDSSTDPSGDFFAIDNLVMNATEVKQEMVFSTTEKDYTFNNLTPSTWYQLKVNSTKEDATSNYSDAVLFTTLELNPIPTDVAVDNIMPNSAHATWNGRGESYSLSLAQIKESTSNYNFDDQTLPEGMTTGGNYPWIFKSYNGGYRIQSGNKGVSNSSSELSLTKDCGYGGTIEFFAIHNGETKNGIIFDKCIFYIDDEEMFVKGNESSASYSYTITPGTHTFTWKYTKDDSSNSPYDCFAIDNLELKINESIQDMEFDTNEPEYTFDNLKPNRTYGLKVKSIKEETESSYTLPIFFTTGIHTFKLDVAGNTLQKLTTEHAGEDIIVSLTRTFKSGVTSTLCLPFELKSLTGGKLYSLYDIVWDDDADAWVANMNDVTPDGNLITSTQAGTPYLFMPESDGEVTFEGIISEVPDSPTAFTLTNKESNNWVMAGTYNRIDWDASMGKMFGFAAMAVEATDDTDAIDAGEFVYAKDGAYFPAYRAFLKYNGNDEILQARAVTHSEYYNPIHVIVRLIGKEHSNTGINSMDVETYSGKWFTIDGRQLDSKPSTKGLYIHQGKKVLINNRGGGGL